MNGLRAVAGYNGFTKCRASDFFVVVQVQRRRLEDFSIIGEAHLRFTVSWECLTKVDLDAQ